MVADEKETALKDTYGTGPRLCSYRPSVFAHKPSKYLGHPTLLQAILTTLKNMFHLGHMHVSSQQIEIPLLGKI